jgi:hypothetical protein
MMRRFAWLCLAVGILCGCARGPAIQSEADRRSCDELIRAMREAWTLRPGTVVQRERYEGRLSPKAAQFALRRGLRANVTGDGAGGYTFFPVLNPFTLLAAAGIEPEKPPGDLWLPRLHGRSLPGATGGGRGARATVRVGIEAE